MTRPSFPSLAVPSRGYVFVVTYGLSGDVGLQALINRFDGVCLRGENGGVINHIADAWHAAAGQAGQSLETFGPLNRLGWQLADSFVESVLSPPDGVRFAGFREIRWSEDAAEFERRLDFLYSFFPDARFVFHGRSPKEVAQLGWWAEQPTQDVVASLERRSELFDAYLTEHPDRGLRLDFEAYIGAPENLKPLFELLETPYSPRLAETWVGEQGS